MGGNENRENIAASEKGYLIGSGPIGSAIAM